VNLDPLLEQLAQRVAELIVARLDGKAAHPDDDRLLDVHEAAALLGVTSRWVYRRAKSLPFTRRLSKGVLRFSEAEIKTYIGATRRGAA